MEHLLLQLKAHNLQNRTVAVMENGSWAPQSGKLMKEILSGMKDMNLLEQGVTIKSSLKEEQMEALESLAQTIAKSVLETE